MGWYMERPMFERGNKYHSMPGGYEQYCLEVEKDENGKRFICCYRCRKIVWGNTIEEAVNAWNGSQNCGAETGGGE